MPQALVYVSSRRCEIETFDLETARAALGDGPVVEARTLWSAISRGTERLVFEGRVPVSEQARMRAPLQRGAFPFPVTYGYAAVGVVEDGPAELMGRTVFALAPHQDRIVAPAAMAIPTPEATPPRRAALAANMETALNAAWDGGAGPGDRIAVVGGGVLGGLLAGLLGALPGAEVTLVDPAPERAGLADALGVAYAAPEVATSSVGVADLVFHTSATAAGLETALALAGDEARVVEMSWFGDATPTVPLGAAFHSRRLQLISSQVGQVAPSRRPRWSYGRRLGMALQLLSDPKYDALITAEIAFADLPAALPHVLASGATGLATVVRYDAS